MKLLSVLILCCHVMGIARSEISRSYRAACITNDEFIVKCCKSSFAKNILISGLSPNNQSLCFTSRIADITSANFKGFIFKNSIWTDDRYGVSVSVRRAMIICGEWQRQSRASLGFAYSRRSGITLMPQADSALTVFALRRKRGATFQRRPSSVMTVTDLRL